MAVMYLKIFIWRFFILIFNMFPYYLIHYISSIYRKSDYGLSHYGNTMNYILIILLFIYLLWLHFMLLLFWEYEKMKKPREINLYERNVQSNNCIAYFGKLANHIIALAVHNNIIYAACKYFIGLSSMSLHFQS
jgi:hypothetical protein